MSYFDVEIESWGGGSALDVERVAELPAALEGCGSLGPVASIGGVTEGLSVSFGIEGDWIEWGKVTDRAIEIFEQACENAGIRHGGVAPIEVVTEDFMSLELQRAPESFVGVAEIARMRTSRSYL